MKPTAPQQLANSAPGEDPFPKAGEAFLRHLIESSQDVLWESVFDGLAPLWDELQAGRITIDGLWADERPRFGLRRVYVSPAVTEMLGWTPAEALALDFEQAFTPASCALQLKVLRESLEALHQDPEGRPPTSPLELQERHKNGSIVYTEIVFRFLYDTDGRPTGVAGQTRDITRRKRAEAALIKQQTVTEQILESSLSGWWDWKIGQGSEYLSPRLKRMFGYDDDELENRPGSWRRFIHPEDLPRVDAMQRQHFESHGKVPYACQFRCHHRDGSTLWIHRAGVVIEWDPAGKPVRMIGSHVNITDLKRGEGEILDQNRMLEGIHRVQTGHVVGGEHRTTFKQLLDVLLESSDSQYGFIGEVEHDPDGAPYLRTHAFTDVAWNEVIRKLFEGDVPASLVFRNLETLFGHVIRHDEALISNDPANDPRASRQLPFGHPPLRSFLGLPIHFRGRLVGIVGLANREGGYTEHQARFLKPLLVTCGSQIGALHIDQQRRESEAMLRELNRRLETVREDERTGIARDLHDELGQLTARLRMDLRAAENFLASLHLPNHRSHLEERLVSASDLAERLVDEIHDIARRLRPTTLDELGLISALQTECRDFTQHSGIACDFAHEGAGPPAPSQEATALFRLAQELMTNVLRHSKATECRVALSFREDTHVLTVTDDGVGFDPKQARRPDAFGILGSRERVAQLDGEIQFDSHPGSGTVVTIRIPARLPA